MSASVAMLNHRTGELRDVDGGDSEQARALRHKLYQQGWQRLSRRRCRLDVDMLACNCVQTVRGERIVGKRHGVGKTYFLRRYLDEQDASDALTGKTLVEVNAEISEAYMRQARLSGACAGKANCVHSKTPVHMDTMDHLKRLGYVEVYRETPGHGWRSLLSKPQGGTV